MINFLVLCRSIISTNAISSTAVPNKTAASLFRVLTVFSNYDHKSADNVCLQLLQRTVRHYRCVTRTALSVNSSRFWPAAARTDIPLLITHRKLLLHRCSAVHIALKQSAQAEATDVSTSLLFVDTETDRRLVVTPC